MYILAKKYKTKWSAKNCIGFLQRKNIYDVLLYEFYMVNGGYCIQFKGLLKQFGGYMPDRDLYMDILAWHTVYILNFEEKFGWHNYIRASKCWRKRKSSHNSYE